MANMFTMILAIVTLITGILWCLERFKLALARRRLIQQRGLPPYCDSAVLAGHEISVKCRRHKLGWIETGASIFPVLLLVFIVRSFIVEPFQIPSRSMMPTLLVGDLILVKKFAYGIKDPITHTTIIKTGLPKRGDVVIFKYPSNPSLNYIKRVIGLPGDRIYYDYINKHLTIHPECTNGQDCTTALPITYSECAPHDLVQNLHVNSNSEASSSSSLLQMPSYRQWWADSHAYLAQCTESFGGGIVHHILMLPGQQDPLGMYYQQPGHSLSEWTVPKASYFMMGDNRDNSADSRYWGCVPERNLVGKAIGIWMSFDKQEDQWPTGLRLSRIGGIK